MEKDNTYVVPVWDFPPGRYEIWFSGAEHSEEFSVTNSVRTANGTVLYLETATGEYINFQNVLTFSKID